MNFEGSHAAALPFHLCSPGGKAPPTSLPFARNKKLGSIPELVLEGFLRQR